jgi:hypothetical protein
MRLDAAPSGGPPALAWRMSLRSPPLRGLKGGSNAKVTGGKEEEEYGYPPRI